VLGTVGDSGTPLSLEEVASSWVMDGSEEEGPGRSSTKGEGGGRVRIYRCVSRRVGQGEVGRCKQHGCVWAQLSKGFVWHWEGHLCPL